MDMESDHLERLGAAMDELGGGDTTPRWPIVNDALLSALLQPLPSDFDLPHVEREEC